MRCLSRLKDVSNLTHIHSYTLLMLGLLTLHATATCTYEYHQRHELHASGNTIEKHNIYNTFTSVLQIMSIAKQQLIKMIDDKTNIVMSRRDCKLIGTGLSYEVIHNMNSSYDKVAKMTRDVIVGSQIMVTGDDFSTLVSVAYYVKMLATLDITYHVNLAADHGLMVVKSGSEDIITNIDNKLYKHMDIVCTISQDYMNIKNIMIPSLKELHSIFNNIMAASKIFPQALNMNDMKLCLGLQEFTYWNIMDMDGEKLERCLKTHRKRSKRNLLAWIDGSQVQIDEVSNALDATIDTFNQDLQEIESFNRQVVSGYNHLQDEMHNVEEYIRDLRDVVILEEIKSDIRERKSFYHRMLLTQAINFNNIVLNSDTSELMRVINNCVYGQLTCTISSCETSLNCGITKDNSGQSVLEIRREYAELHNSAGYLINCVPVSPTHISTWHGCLAAGYSNSSLVLKKKIVNFDDLSNDKLVNEEVRPIADKEKVLGNFIILPSKIICLNHIEAFQLDTKTVSCESLQAIEVKTNYTLKLGNESYVHSQKTLSHKRKYTIEKGVYRELTHEIASFEPTVYDTIMKTIFLNKIGKVSHEKSSAFGIVMFLVTILIIGIIYWKCQCCRKNVKSCYEWCTPHCVDVWKENRALQNLHDELAREARLNQLDPEGAHIYVDDGDDDRQAVACESHCEHISRDHAAPQGARPPSCNSSNWEQ